MIGGDPSQLRKGLLRELATAAEAYPGNERLRLRVMTDEGLRELEFAQRVDGFDGDLRREVEALGFLVLDDA